MSGSAVEYDRIANSQSLLSSNAMKRGSLTSPFRSVRAENITKDWFGNKDDCLNPKSFKTLTRP